LSTADNRFTTEYNEFGGIPLIHELYGPLVVEGILEKSDKWLRLGPRLSKGKWATWAGGKWEGRKSLRGRSSRALNHYGSVGTIS